MFLNSVIFAIKQGLNRLYYSSVVSSSSGGGGYIARMERVSAVDGLAYYIGIRDDFKENKVLLMIFWF